MNADDLELSNFIEHLSVNFQVKVKKKPTRCDNYEYKGWFEQRVNVVLAPEKFATRVHDDYTAASDENPSYVAADYLYHRRICLIQIYAIFGTAVESRMRVGTRCSHYLHLRVYSGNTAGISLTGKKEFFRYVN